MALPTITEGVSPGEGLGFGLGQLGNLPELIQQKQLEELTVKAQRAQQGTLLDQFFKSQAQANPALLRDSKFKALVESNNKMAGLPGPPMDPAQSALTSQGVGGYPGINRKAQPEQIDSSWLGGEEGDQDFFTKQFASLQAEGPEARIAQFTAEQGRPPTDAERARLTNIVEQLSPEEFDKRVTGILGRLNTQVKTAATSGNPAAIADFAKSAYAQMMAIPHDPNDKTFDDFVANTLSPYFDGALDDLSPMQRAKLQTELSKSGKNDAQIAEIRELLQGKVALDQARVDEYKAQAAHLREQTTEIDKLLNGKLSLQGAQLKKYLADAATDADRSAQSRAEAQWYSERANQAKTNPTLKVAAVNALQKTVDDDSRSISQLFTNIQSFQNSINNDPKGAAQYRPQLQVLQQQLKNLQDERAMYQQKLSEINNYGLSSFAPSPYIQSPTGAYNPYDPSQNQPDGAAPQTQATRTGRTAHNAAGAVMYEYSDGSWKPQ
jgi:hypothetical protein